MWSFNSQNMYVNENIKQKKSENWFVNEGTISLPSFNGKVEEKSFAVIKIY